MNKEKTRQQLVSIFSVLLGKSVNQNDDISMEYESLWDSIKHIEIISTIEEEFNISFDIGDIPKLTSMKKIFDKILERNE